LTECYLTESTKKSFDLKQIAQKVVWPKIHLTESSFDLKFFLRVVIWPNVFFEIWSFDRKFFIWQTSLSPPSAMKEKNWSFLSVILFQSCGEYNQQILMIKKIKLNFLLLSEACTIVHKARIEARVHESGWTPPSEIHHLRHDAWRRRRHRGNQNLFWSDADSKIRIVFRF
jgi:hypothetical protein